MVRPDPHLHHAALLRRSCRARRSIHFGFSLNVKMEAHGDLSTTMEMFSGLRSVPVKELLLMLSAHEVEVSCDGAHCGFLLNDI